MPNDAVQIEGLEKLERDLNKLERSFKNRLPYVGKKIQDAWVWTMHTRHIIDKGWYLRSIGLHSLDSHSMMIDTSNDARVIYSDVVERGRRDRPNYPAQEPVRETLDRMMQRDELAAEFDYAVEEALD